MGCSGGALLASQGGALLMQVKTGITRGHCQLETMHGKNICDGYSNVPTSSIRLAIAGHHLIDPGTRELVLYLAANKQSPSTLKGVKAGWWAATRIFWGECLPWVPLILSYCSPCGHCYSLA
jgi:hypothetical protein